MEHRGFVTNLSASGLYLQTRAKLESGTKLMIEVEANVDSQIVLTGTVARMRRSHRATTVIHQPGIGIELVSAPEAYFQLIMELLEFNESQSD